MDDKSFKERASRLKQVGAVIESLPAEIRLAAFHVLSDYLEGDQIPIARRKAKTDAGAKKVTMGEDEVDDREKFFSEFNHDKPSDNVKLLVAFHYREYGAQAFKADELKVLADNVGITVPERIDMTLRQATADGKRLFASAGRALFKPTVHGEAYLKREYSVKKGTKAKAQDDDDAG